MEKPSPPPPTEADMRARYARTGLYRMGIPFERAMQCQAVRIVVGAAAVQGRATQQPSQQEAA